MADSAKFTVTDGIGSYLEWHGGPIFSSIGLDHFTYSYVGLQIFIPTATEATWLGGAYNDSPMMLWMLRSTGSLVDYIGLYDSNSDDVYDKWETNYEGDTSTLTTIAGSWHKVEWLRDPANGPGPYKLRIDGTELFSDFFGPSTTIDKIRIGAAQQHSLAPNAGVVYISDFKMGTSDGASNLFNFDARTAVDLSQFDALIGTVSLDTAPTPPPDWTVAPPPPPPPPPPYVYPGVGQRFFQGYPWRFLVTDLDTKSITWANGLLTDRQIVYTLNDATVIAAGIHPDDFRVNGLMPPDGLGNIYPRVAQSNRLVYCFRREGNYTDPNQPDQPGPWHIRAAGILMSPEDEGDEDAVMTHFHAYDPRKLLEGRPVMDEFGALPDAAGFTYLSVTPDEIALTVLRNTISSEGTVHIDAGFSNGGTTFYAGTLETFTDPVVFTVQRGQSVADVWNQLCEEGLLDLVLTPIYDPVNRPGYTHELSIYKLAGVERRAAMFAWDRLNRSVSKASRVHDGTPGAFFNVVQYFAGQGGFPIPAAGPLVNSDSATTYGRYWAQQFFPSQTSTDVTGAATLALAKQALVLAKQGRRTYTVETIAERAPVPLLAYGLGDRVQIDNSARMRVVASGLQRVQAIAINIDDDGVERVGPLLCTPDWDTTRES